LVLQFHSGASKVKNMTSADAAAIFEKIALLMELKGENPFKIRAYRSGAEIVESLGMSGVNALRLSA
jgi:DNA polymerase/3'-5' exonuclease PolX